MTMDGVPGLVALVVVSLATLAIGTYGLRISRTTSDFYVASRSVRPGLNASAIGGEYLSAASFLGVAALVLTAGAQMLWYPIGWTAGYLVLLVLVAAPLRRSGAYTLPDFAEARLGSRRVRALCSVLVVAIGWLYLLPQFQGAGLTLTAAVDAPKWVGALVVGAVVVVNVSSGGMRSITFVQAFQYWLKLTALLVPAAVLLVVWVGDGSPTRRRRRRLVAAARRGQPGPLHDVLDRAGHLPRHHGAAARGGPLLHQPRRRGRPPDHADRAGPARRLLPASADLRVLGRAYGADADDTVVLELPRLMLDGPSGDLLTGLVTAGAFAAFLSTSSGLAIAVSGVIAQDVLGGRLSGVSAFRVAATVAVGVPLAAAVLAPDLSVARAVGLAFAVAASTFCPLLVLGIWWRGLTSAGAVAGLLIGGLGAGAGVAWTLYDGAPETWRDVLLGQPAAWSVPLAFAAMVGVSLVTREAVPGAREPVHGAAAHAGGRAARPRLTQDSGPSGAARGDQPGGRAEAHPAVHLAGREGGVQRLERGGPGGGVQVGGEPTREAHPRDVLEGVVGVAPVLHRLVDLLQLEVDQARAREQAADPVGVRQPERARRTWRRDRQDSPCRQGVAQDGHPLVVCQVAPGQEPDPAPGPQRAREVVKRAHGVAEEHRTEAADHHVEGSLGEGSDLGVRVLVGRVGDRLGLGQLACQLEHATGEVHTERRPRGGPERGGPGQAPRAAPNVEHHVPVTDQSRGEEPLPVGAGGLVVVRGLLGPVVALGPVP